MEKCKCSMCGNEFILGEGGIVFDGKHLCSSCMQTFTVTCTHCCERIWREDAVHDYYCMHCFDEYYTTCSSCGTVIHQDSAYYLERDEDSHDYPYCRSCCENITEIIHNYYYKPEPIFYGRGRYFGIELEVDDAGEYDENAKLILDVGNAEDELIFIKHDGSLDEGFEIVSHPCSKDYHINEFPWREILRKAISLGYRSHQAGSCGLHIHVNRDSFGKSIEKQEEAIGRILYFYEKFYSEILRFSRRTNSEANRWAARYGGYIDNPKESLKTAKTSGLGRYVAVNLSNCNTIEFRIMRGTLKYDTFIATLQFTDILCNLAQRLDDESFKNMTWLEFVENIPKEKNKELIDYLKQRRLYINEPVESEEEI